LGIANPEILLALPMHVFLNWMEYHADRLEQRRSGGWQHVSPQQSLLSTSVATHPGDHSGLSQKALPTKILAQKMALANAAMGGSVTIIRGGKVVEK